MVQHDGKHRPAHGCDARLIPQIKASAETGVRGERSALASEVSGLLPVTRRFQLASLPKPVHFPATRMDNGFV